jgi:hypothetical protein
MTDTTTEPDPIFDPFRAMLSKNLLRSLVGRDIFCKGMTCGGKVLDARRAIAAGSTVICVECWQGLDAKLQQQVLDLGKTDPTALLDGPALHGNKPKLVVTKP